jgi:hypothetical protein
MLRTVLRPVVGSSEAILSGTRDDALWDGSYSGDFSP